MVADGQRRPTNAIERTFVNRQRLIGAADYGTEYLLWHVKIGERYVPVRRAEGARVLEREACDRLPPGVISRSSIALALPAGAELLLVIKRPKAMRLSRREHRAFWLTRSGQLSRRPPVSERPPSARRPPPERLSIAQQAELARNLVQAL